MRRVVWYKVYAANKAEARKAGFEVTPRVVGPRQVFDDFEFYGGHLGIAPPVWRNGQKFCGGRRMIDTPDGEFLETKDMLFGAKGEFVGYDPAIIKALQDMARGGICEKPEEALDLV